MFSRYRYPLLAVLSLTLLAPRRSLRPATAIMSISA